MPRHVLGYEPDYVLKHVPKYVLRHMPVCVCVCVCVCVSVCVTAVSIHFRLMNSKHHPAKNQIYAVFKKGAWRN